MVINNPFIENRSALTNPSIHHWLFTSMKDRASSICSFQHRQDCPLRRLRLISASYTCLVEISSSTSERHGRAIQRSRRILTRSTMSISLIRSYSSLLERMCSYVGLFLRTLSRLNSFNSSAPYRSTRRMSDLSNMRVLSYEIGLCYQIAC